MNPMLEHFTVCRKTLEALGFATISVASSAATWVNYFDATAKILFGVLSVVAALYAIRASQASIEANKTQAALNRAKLQQLSGNPPE